MKTVKICDSPFEAHVVKERLRNDGIEAVVLNENSSRLLGFAAAVQSLHPQVAVDDADYEQAVSLLGDPKEAEAATTVCPECGSANIRSVLDKNPLRRIGIVLWVCVAAFNIASPGYVRKHHICRDCGCEFR